MFSDNSHTKNHDVSGGGVAAALDVPGAGAAAGAGGVGAAAGRAQRLHLPPAHAADHLILPHGPHPTALYIVLMKRTSKQ